MPGTNAIPSTTAKPASANRILWARKPRAVIFSIAASAPPEPLAPCRPADCRCGKRQHGSQAKESASHARYGGDGSDEQRATRVAPVVVVQVWHVRLVSGWLAPLTAMPQLVLPPAAMVPL